jgi:hypothetical protein
MWISQIVIGLFVVVILLVVEREIKKFKKWVEELVGFVRRPTGQPAIGHPELDIWYRDVHGQPLEGVCESCGKKKAVDFIECPTCHQKHIDAGICGTRWNEAAMQFNKRPGV